MREQFFDGAEVVDVWKDGKVIKELGAVIYIRTRGAKWELYNVIS